MRTRKVSINLFQVIIALIIIIALIATIVIIFKVNSDKKQDELDSTTIKEFTGAGSLEEPYIIATEDDLKALYENILKGETYNGKNLKMTDKIELTKEIQNSKIKSTSKPVFEGVFDGDGNSITGLILNIKDASSDGYYGLFGLNKGTIINLRVTGQITVDGNIENSNMNIGMIAGKNEGIIASCKVEGSITANINKETTKIKIGGIAGTNSGNIFTSSSSAQINSNQQKAGITAVNEAEGGDENSGSITNCANNGDIKEETSSNYYTAGICAENILGTISSCNNNGNIQGKLVGGITGKTTGNIISCQNTGKISNLEEQSNNDEISGGITAILESATIENCKNTGAISGLTDIGGIAGQNKGKILQATNEGEISKIEEVAEKVNIGGIVGSNLEQASISGSKNYGSIKSLEDNIVILGGICGALYNNSTIENCENNGSLQAQSKIITPNEDLTTNCTNCKNNSGGRIETTETGELQIGLIYGNIKQ